MTYTELPEKAKIKAEIVQNVIENGSTAASRRRACIRLGVCEKTLSRYINGLMCEKYEVFVHGNSGKTPATVIPKEIREKIINIYLQEYPNASFTHFKEILSEDYNINVSVSSLANILKYESLIVSPLANKSTVIKYSQKLKRIKSLEKKNNEQVEVLERAKYLLEETSAGARKPRKQYFGELIEMDASSLSWVEGQDNWHLHVAIDDATSEIVGAFFDTQETLHGYYMVLKQIIQNYGIPLTFRTDRRTCFEYSLRNDTPVSQAGRSKKNKKERLEDENPALTQFGMALGKLGIDLTALSDPLFKARCERLNNTLQNRLPVDLKRAKIKTLDEANAFLPAYIKKLNAKFSIKNDKHISNSVFVQGPTEEDLNTILAIRVERVISASVIKCENKLWAIYDKDGNRLKFVDKTPCTVIKALDKSMFVEVNSKVYALMELPEALKSSTALGDKEDNSYKKLEKKPYIPPLNHPWRYTKGGIN